MHTGTALCSMRSELNMRSLFTSLFSRSYSTYYSIRDKHITKDQTSSHSYIVKTVD